VKVNRRGFLVGSALVSLAGTAGGRPRRPQTALPPPPPGCGSVENLLAHCTGCNLCMARCPSNVLKAAGLEYGLAGVMMPRMDFTRGFCRPDCNACGQACPTGAIRPFAPSDKKMMRQAVAVFDRTACLVETEKLTCGNCVRHCPYAAVVLEKETDGRSYPKVDPSACVGCGACEYHCPTKAIAVVGRTADGKGMRT